MVDLVKLKRAAIHSEWLYVKAVNPARPQRAFEHDDIAWLSAIIKDINAEYQAAKQQYGTNACFHGCKEHVLQRNCLDEETRNFFASVLATYFRWRQSRNEAEYLKKAPHLDRLTAYREHTCPKHL